MSTPFIGEIRIGASMAGRLFHFLGEVEVVFGVWVLPLAALMTAQFGPGTTVHYLNHRVNYVEAVFVVVIMSMSLREMISLSLSHPARNPLP